MAVGEAPENEKLRKKPKNNVKFYQIESPFSAISFRSRKLLAASALRDLNTGEKLLVGYGNTYKVN